MKSERFHCEDCDEELHEIYMVTDELWAALGLSRTQNLHFRCMMKRLARPLAAGELRMYENLKAKR